MKQEDEKITSQEFRDMMGFEIKHSPASMNDLADAIRGYRKEEPELITFTLADLGYPALGRHQCEENMLTLYMKSRDERKQLHLVLSMDDVKDESFWLTELYDVKGSSLFARLSDRVTLRRDYKEERILKSRNGEQ